VHAALDLLETMTLRPDDLRSDHVTRLLETGVSEAGVVDALYVGFLFNLIDRVADSLGFEVVSRERFDKGADRLLTHGYL
jgi:alkylhydroperoxidase family enzyme